MSRERTATPEEWAGIIADVHARAPRIARYLEGGAALIGPDGVRINPPPSYVASSLSLVRKTTLTFAPQEASN